MAATASRMRSGGMVSAMRQKPSPDGPKLAPGVTMTPDASMSSSAKAIESVRP